MGEIPRNNPEQGNAEGIHWLKLLGEEHLIGVAIPYEKNGRKLNAEDFPELCGDHARPSFVALEHMDASDPRRTQLVGILRKVLYSYVGEPKSE